MGMSSNQKVNLNWASDVIGIMQNAGKDYNSPDIMLGEVVTPPPALTIKVNNIILYTEQLLVADYLLPWYKRAYYQDGVLHYSAQADDELTGKTKPKETPGETPMPVVIGQYGPHDHGEHTHPEHDHELDSIDVTTTKDKFFAHGDGNDPVVSDGRFNGTDAADKYFYFTDTLKAKDLVLVQQLPNMHCFVVTNKLVRMSEFQQ